jgi:hypothetical protein
MCFGLKCVNAQKRCLEAENLTLDKTISIGKAFEMTEKASVEMHGSKNGDTIGKITKKPAKKPKNPNNQQQQKPTTSQL